METEGGVSTAFRTRRCDLGERSGNEATEFAKRAVSHLFKVQLWIVSVRAKGSFRKFFWGVLA